MNPLRHFIKRDKYSRNIESHNPKLTIISNTDDQGRVLTYTVVNIDKPYKNYMPEFNTLREAKEYTKNYKDE